MNKYPVHSITISGGTMRTALAALIGAAQNAEVTLNTISDDSRTPSSAQRQARADARGLDEAVRAVEAALKTSEVTQ